MKKLRDFRKQFSEATAIAVMTASSPSLFAQDIVPAGMTTLMDSILAVFTGPLVKTILILCLVGCAIAYGFNKDNEKMKRNVIAIAIAIGVVVGATTIVGSVWKAGGGS
jgi:type IV secretory pathway VirB2 component (pilin)